MDDQLRVTRGLEDASGFFELFAQLFIVVELSIHDRVDVSITAVHRLLTSGKVDD